MTQDRSVNISGSGKLEGILSTGDNTKNSYKKNADETDDYLDDLQEIIKQLMQRYPNAPDTQKQIVFQM